MRPHFAMILAFIAPGFLGFVAASYHLPSVRALIAAQNSEAGDGRISIRGALASVTRGIRILFA
jgi:hypothetical protein